MALHGATVCDNFWISGRWTSGCRTEPLLETRDQDRSLFVIYLNTTVTLILQTYLGVSQP